MQPPPALPEKTGVETYCVGEGWISVAVGKAVEPYLCDAASDGEAAAEG
ncbi:DUF3297 family protein [Lichenicola sp.]